MFAHALVGTTMLKPELVKLLPTMSPISGRGRPTVPVPSLVPPLVRSPDQSSTPSIPAQPWAVTSATQPETSRPLPVLTICPMRGVSTRPIYVLLPTAPGPDDQLVSTGAGAGAAAAGAVGAAPAALPACEPDWPDCD